MVCQRSDRSSWIRVEKHAEIRTAALWIGGIEPRKVQATRRLNHHRENFLLVRSVAEIRRVGERLSIGR